MNNPRDIIHATTVDIAGRGVLIIGPSGAGKSSLALELISRGARLVADDRTCIVKSGDRVIASVPATIAGQIEARGVGILSIEIAGPTPLELVVDLSQTETERLPERHWHDVLGHSLPCLYHAPSPHFAAAVLLYLGQGIGTGI